MKLMLRAVRSDGARATFAAAVRSVGRMALTIALARQADMALVATFAAVVAVEHIVVCSLGAMWSSPQAVLAPRRRSQVRQMIHATAERAQLYCGAVLVLVVCGAMLLLSAVPTDQAIAFAAFLLSSIVLQAKRATRICEFRANGPCIAEVCIAGGGLCAVMLAVWLELPILTCTWGAVAVVQLLVTGVWAGGKPSRIRHGRIMLPLLAQTGGKMLAGSLAVSLSGRTQPLILAACVSPGAVALFAVANTCGAPLRLVGGALRGPLLPRLARRGGMGDLITAERVCAMITAVVLCSLLTHIAAGMAVVWVFGAAFRDAAVLIGPIVAASLLGLANSLLVTGHQAAGRAGWCSAVRWGGAIFGLCAMCVGVMAAGMLGMVWSLVVSECAIGCVLLAKASQVKESEPRRIAACI